MTLRACNMYASRLPVVSSFIPSASHPEGTGQALHPSSLFIGVAMTPNEVSMMEENRPLTTDY